MPRVARPFTPDHPHHLISRFTNLEYRLRDDEDRERYLKTLRECVARCHGALVLAYALMSTHIHLVAFGASEPIGALLHPLNSSYGRWWNKKYGGKGRVFAERPKSIVVADTTHLAALVAYVHNNPARAGLVQDPRDTNWTSHNQYMSGTGWMNTDVALEWMGFDSTEQGRLDFHRFVCGRAGHSRDPRFSGVGRCDPETVTDLVQAVSEVMGVPRDRVLRPAGDPRAKLARRFWASLAKLDLGSTVRVAARATGLSTSQVQRLFSSANAADSSELRHQVLDRFVLIGGARRNP